MKSKTLRSKKGAGIAETAASMSLMIPLLILIVFATVETTQAYLIQSSLAQGARRAARNLAIAYGQNPAVASSRSLQDSTVLQYIRIPNFINDNAQFDDPVFDISTNPHTVRVEVHYRSGQYGLPVFPQPDPLNIADKITITAESTYRLE